MIELSDDLGRKIAELSRQTGRAERDLVADAVAIYLRSHLVPRPASDGTIDDPGLNAADIDDWLAANWRPD